MQDAQRTISDVMPVMLDVPEAARLLGERRFDLGIACLLEVGKSRFEAIGEAEEPLDVQESLGVAQRPFVTYLMATGRLRPGFGYEFLERADGFPGLAKTYGLEFPRRPAQMDLGLLYPALQGRQVDLIAGNSTDGLIDAIGGVVLEDDRRYFPPYEAAFVVRGLVWKTNAAVREVLQGLGYSEVEIQNLEDNGVVRTTSPVAPSLMINTLI